MEKALIGLLGVLIGILCTEYFRRRNRIEIYSHKIFERRLKIHEDLFSKLKKAHAIIGDMSSKNSLSSNERHEIVSSIILDLCEFCDENDFYIDKYLTAQVATLFMGSEEIADIKDVAERKVEISRINQNYLATRKMIVKESGAHEVFKHFKTISKSSLDSDVIRHLKEIEKNKV